MSKLLTEPIVPKDIVIPKKFKKTRKAEGREVNYKLISETGKTKVNELLEVYKEDKFKARVKYFNNPNIYTFERTVLFTFGPEDFEICYFTVKFGMSIASRIYSRQKKKASIIYSKGKFWYRTPKGIKPLTFTAFTMFIGKTENVHYYHQQKIGSSNNQGFERSVIYSFFKERFHWMQMLMECPIASALTFNQIVSKKLFGMKDMFRQAFNMPPKMGATIYTSKAFKVLTERDRGCKAWRDLLPYLDGPEHLTLDLLNYPDFIDTCNMAKTLGRKVNCRWGLKRIKDEHDAWALEIGNIVLSCDKEYPLNLKPLYQAFEEYSGYRMMKTNKDMLLEGMMQKHCVGTYIDKVNRGTCAIYHVDGYTLQVGVGDFLKEVSLPNLLRERITSDNVPADKKEERIYNMQFRGKYNSTPPKELFDAVQAKLDGFMADGWYAKVKDNKYVPIETKEDDLFDLGDVPLIDGGPIEELNLVNMFGEYV